MCIFHGYDADCDCDRCGICRRRNCTDDHEEYYIDEQTRTANWADDQCNDCWQYGCDGHCHDRAWGTAPRHDLSNRGFFADDIYTEDDDIPF